MSDRTAGGMTSLEDVLRGASDPMPDAARAVVRARVVARVASEGRLARARFVFVRSAAAFATTATLLAGTGYAAASAVPGDFLYPAKRAAEEIRIAFSSNARQDDALLEMTRERAREVGELLDSQASEQDVMRAADLFGQTADRAVESQPTAEAEQETVRQIEDVVSGESPGVQEAVGGQVPEPSGTQDPEPDPSPDPPSGAQPDPQPDSTPGQGPGAESEQPGPGPGSDSDADGVTPRGR